MLSGDNRIAQPARSKIGKRSLDCSTAANSDLDFAMRYFRSKREVIKACASSNSCASVREPSSNE